MNIKKLMVLIKKEAIKLKFDKKLFKRCGTKFKELIFKI